MVETISTQLLNISFDGQDGSRPLVTRSDHECWSTLTGNRARLLGVLVAETLTDALPTLSDNELITIAGDLTTQQPPFNIVPSWAFLDGVFEYLESTPAELEGVAA